MKKLILSLAVLFATIGAFAQTGGVKGTLVDRANRSIRIPSAELTLIGLRSGEEVAKGKSQTDGTFLLDNVEDGMYTMVIEAQDYNRQEINVTIDNGFIKDMVIVGLTQAPTQNEVLEEDVAELSIDDAGFAETPTILFQTNDVFASVTGYDFSAVRWKSRGYNSESQQTIVSGISLNDAVTGYSPYSLWSGLNEASRSKSTTIGLKGDDNTFGGYNGVSDITFAPSEVRPGTRFSVLTNSSLYRLRVMGTYATGLTDKGWAFAVNASARLGGNDWVKGVYYRSFAYYLGAEKRFDEGRHILSLVTFAAPGRRGSQNASTQEVYDLVGSNTYNSNWGYQTVNGKRIVRNSREKITFEPVTILKYQFHPIEDLKGHVTFLWRTGSNGSTALDWNDAADPRPDYYRNLPSYFSNASLDYMRYSGGDPYFKNNPTIRVNDVEKQGLAWDSWVMDQTRTYSQLNWDHLFNINYNNWAANPATGEQERRSKYVVEERHQDQNDLNLATTVNWRILPTLTLNAGLTGRYNNTHYYKVIGDLLGGDYYLNTDNFAERDFGSDPSKIQNDLDYYNEHGHAQVLRKGDKYGYDYIAKVRNAGAWAVASFDRNGLTADLGVKYGFKTMQREGLYRKGLFPDDSKGNSPLLKFHTYGVKASAGYFFAGAHKVEVNAGIFSDAPQFTNAFVSPRTRNSVIANLTTQKVYTADANYWFSKSGYEVRATVYYSEMKDGTKLMSFYDDTQNSFTNFAMSGIGERHIGTEVAFKVPLPVKGLTIQGAVAYSYNIYTSTPTMTQTIDNSDRVVYENVPVKYWAFHYDIDGKKIQHHVGSTPELASVLALKYRTNDYWFFELSGNFFAMGYLDMNPGYRTLAAVVGPEYNPLEPESRYVDPATDDVYQAHWAHEAYMASQEQFKPAFLLNASVGKSWYFQRKYNLGFSLSVRNITNNRNVKTGGYEQTRLLDSTQKNCYYRYDSKYFYMPGINYMLNVYFKF